MDYKIEKKSAPGRGEVEGLGATFEEGNPAGEDAGRWRQKVGGREGRRVGVGGRLVWVVCGRALWGDCVGDESTEIV